MRFYLNVPLVAGYLSMATVACLGMLQLAAARGGYAGLSLFAAERERGVRIGAALTIGALLAYTLFAPEILTPGPAGTEVAEMFVLCALVALGTTLVGADLRLQRAQKWKSGAAEHISLEMPGFDLYYPSPAPRDQQPTGKKRVPAVALLLDPTDFVVAPSPLVEELCHAGVAVLVVGAHELRERDAPLSRRTLLGQISMALVRLAQQPGIDLQRIGLLGLGLSGDAALRAAATDPELKAALAVSPVMWMALDLEEVSFGLQWLHELSYRQIWGWRRRWSEIARSAANLAALDLPETTIRVPTAVLYADSTVLTMRINQGVDRLEAEGQGHFRLLENERARQLVVRWLQEKLKKDE